MLLRLATRPFPPFRSATALFHARTLVSSSRPALRASHRARVGLITGAVLATSLLAGNVTSPIHADAEQSDNLRSESARPQTPLSALVRSYIVYSICSVPAIVDWSPTILSVLFSLPGIRQIAQAVVRVTFFDQFVGADSAEDAIPLLEQLRAENKGCLFAYSVEVDEDEASGTAKDDKHAKLSTHKQIITETLHCIDVAADFENKYSSHHGSDMRGRKTWVAVKMSAMLPRTEALVHFSKYLVSTRPKSSPSVAFPGRPLSSDFDVLSSRSATNSFLTDSDIADLRELRDDLREICKRAREHGVKIIVDAEYSWYQPAIDAFTLSLQREFNRLPSSSWFRLGNPTLHTSAVQPLVYQTYQAYLRRTPEYLKQSLAAARAEGYSLGVKLVRGAYHPHEMAAHASAMSTRTSTSTLISSYGYSQSISPDPAPPVWSTKDETDTCYNACATLLLEHLRADIKAARADGSPRLGILFGTHNWNSCELILSELAKLGLASVTGATTWVPETVTERVAIGQLYGMSDALTDSLVSRTRCASPFVMKYIPYGNLAEVMPYLSRRAIENKSVLGNGGAADERRRAGSEIRKRIASWSGLSW
ncbi:uncharacterized protein FIBRA_05858 [Fibroporia radiculosa]|uniref:Proline dehydrogenase n=1 Tax=Fibroporia radiculosa TaxID=599839 RepID=J4HY81_9APHY|nr:uncharacterized protein FIBRA_05858 [Fibroporia radiculosa]CCM03712.1 predicted protein [Fibroporia radiculosa]